MAPGGPVLGGFFRHLFVPPSGFVSLHIPYVQGESWGHWEQREHWGKVLGTRWGQWDGGVLMAVTSPWGSDVAVCVCVCDANTWMSPGWLRSFPCLNAGAP